MLEPAISDEEKQVCTVGTIIDELIFYLLKARLI